jgi:hypothetical protein
MSAWRKSTEFKTVEAKSTTYLYHAFAQDGGGGKCQLLMDALRRRRHTQLGLSRPVPGRPPRSRRSHLSDGDYDAQGMTKTVLHSECNTWDGIEQYQSLSDGLSLRSV